MRIMSCTCPKVISFRCLSQVYVMVYADGPTRVLCFSDEPSIQLVEAEQSVLDLAARLKQVRIYCMHM